MPKFFYMRPEDIGAARPLREDLWFDLYQPLLLRLLASRYGRDLLCVDNHPWPIVGIKKNAVTYLLERSPAGNVYMTDFRVGAKWANVARYRWPYVRAALDRMNLESLLELPHLVLTPSKILLPVPSGATESTFYPDAHVETTTVDGMVGCGELGNESWATLEGHAGGYSNDNSIEIELAINTNATGFNTLRRGITLFNTGPTIPADNSITDATLSMATRASSLDQLSISPALQIVSSAPASDTALANGDFDSLGSTGFSTAIPFMSFAALGVYNSWVLDANGIANITKGSGVSKFGGIESVYDLGGSTPGHTASSTTRCNVSAADTTGTNLDPKLVVTHAAPTFVPYALIL